MLRKLFSRKNNTIQRPLSEGATALAVKFDPKLITPFIEKDIREFVLSFDEIPQGKQKIVIDAALESLKGGGGNSFVVFTALQAAGMEKKRSLVITDLIIKRSRWRVNTQRQTITGIFEAEWVWAGAPCITSNPPSPEEAEMSEQHKAANGRKFDIREGLLIDGKKQFPGLAYNCKCVSRIVLPF
ncbi:hypothetical protein [Gluconobacter sphaericus]|uniref:Phage head morphogenesis domain-containing protein n=1 Tax=Gluconobacter sphaericus NBRC 12467 TaxID=1307951 RepID=A0AA37SKP9_9PROT|nr:hypothetical protein [Gluconobacter sphaericus]MBF0885523.1 hypothetical protein [Gluconobacter sphaericus]GBR56467.1 hypothetical protein AA12467_2626 [Gluconobacter sphaericus NBRC 12467]GEB42760.1 hypothetical protein GSP01_15420 [Gluconobacter sphaericus NBRC 12467]GLQ84736.1 hypothetical protein GCM10007872_16440 [Gluconobacter sphaericus NBRC 12467]GLQ85109.1 hypothetical protein GCM10007872_20170 [Gluconobacter sphaericus NBRC 12467]